MKKIRKAPSYRIHGSSNLIGIQDKKEHARKKRIFQHGFSTVALRRHEPKVIREIEIFCDVIGSCDQQQGISTGWSEAKDANLWCK
jgi:hypothetical protein